MLPCVCSVIHHRRRQNVVRTSVTHSAVASCATFLLLPHFDVICHLLLNRHTATWNLFVIYNNMYYRDVIFIFFSSALVFILLVISLFALVFYAFLFISNLLPFYDLSPFSFCLRGVSAFLVTFLISFAVKWKEKSCN